MISTRWFTATSVTKAVDVSGEKVAQHVATWSRILVEEDTVAILEDERERVAAPKDASVTKSSEVLGRRAVPKRTAVPEGEERVSTVETVLFSTGKTERKPVLFIAGSPFTVVNRAVDSALKNVWDTVFNGPTGGVV